LKDPARGDTHRTMRRFLATFSSVMGLLSLLASNARGAGPREVLVSRGAGGCVYAEGLARAIHRDTSLPVRVVAPATVAERPDQIMLRTTGRDRDITVTIQGAGFDIEQQAHAASCETATDVVAALVVSAVAPPPAVVIPPSAETAPLTNERIEKLIGDALARRAVQLAELGVHMSIDVTGGRYTARLALLGGRCPRVRSVDLGSDLKPETMAAVAATVIFPQVAAMVEEHKNCLANDKVARKAALLNADLDIEASLAKHQRSFASVALVLDAALSAVWFKLAYDGHEPMMTMWGAAWATGSAAEASLLVGGDYAQATSASLLFAGGGLLVLGLGVGQRQESRWSPYAVGGLSGALFLESALTMSGALLQRPVSVDTLVADQHRVASAEDRDQLTEEEFAHIEDDFRRSSSPLPRWLIAAPWFAGGAVALGATFADKNPIVLNRVFQGVDGAIMFAGGFLAAFPQSGYWHYQRALAQHGLQASLVTFPGASGGGIVVRGAF